VPAAECGGCTRNDPTGSNLPERLDNRCKSASCHGCRRSGPERFESRWGRQFLNDLADAAAEGDVVGGDFQRIDDSPGQSRRAILRA